MTKMWRKSRMFYPTIIMGVITFTLLIIGYNRGQGEHVTGLKSAFNLTFEILPLLIFAFIIAGMVPLLLPKELLSKWVGTESGMRGILIGTMVVFLTGWSLWAIGRFPMEIGIVGWKFTLIRFVSTFFFPPIAGFIAQTFFGNAKL